VKQEDGELHEKSTILATGLLLLLFSFLQGWWKPKYYLDLSLFDIYLL